MPALAPSRATTNATIAGIDAELRRALDLRTTLTSLIVADMAKVDTLDQTINRLLDRRTHAR